MKAATTTTKTTKTTTTTTTTTTNISTRKEEPCDPASHFSHSVMAPTAASSSTALGGVASQALARPKSVIRNWQSFVTSKLPDEATKERGT
jgi:hypothetical protein